MANEDHLAKLREGVAVWNEWRMADMDIIPDLIDADLTRADLTEALLWAANLINADLTGARLIGSSINVANLRNTSLIGANLHRADFHRSDLTRANLTGADLTGAVLRRTSLIGANLHRANLTEADLTGAILIGANLSGVNLSRVELSNTIFAFTDLSTVEGLKTCNHRGPSSIDHNTLAGSGKLPDVFLRGCGLPEALIDYLPSLHEEASQYYSSPFAYFGNLLEDLEVSFFVR